MPFHHLLQLAFLLTPLWTSTHNLISASPLQPRQNFICTNPNLSFSPTCWQTLNLGDFLTNPKTGWNTSTGSGQSCNSGDNAAYCCRSTETWSTCFIRQSTDLANKHLQCGLLNSTTCPTNSFTMVTQVPQAVQPKHRYVLRNIYSIFQLFTSWNQALPQAITDANANLHGLISEVDPQGRISVNESSTLQSFLLGFPLLASPNAKTLVTPQLHPTTNTSAKALLQGLQKAPAISKALFPPTAPQPASLKLGDVQPYLATNATMAQMSEQLDAALGLVMSDLDAFVNFAGSGLFSGAGDFGVEGDDQGLDVGVESFVMSAADNDSKYSDLAKALDIGF